MMILFPVKLNCWNLLSTGTNIKKIKEDNPSRILYLSFTCQVFLVLYLKFLAERESIEELNSFTGHQFKAKSSLDDLKRTTHFYNLTILVFSRYPDCPGTYLCYWLPFAGPWSFITSRFCFTARQARLWFSLVMPCICRSTNSTQKLHFRNPVILLFGESRRASQN